MKVIGSREYPWESDSASVAYLPSSGLPPCKNENITAPDLLLDGFALGVYGAPTFIKKG